MYKGGIVNVSSSVCIFFFHFWHDRLDMNELLIPTVWLFHSRFRQKSAVEVETLYNYIVKMASECRLFFPNVYAGVTTVFNRIPQFEICLYYQTNMYIKILINVYTSSKHVINLYIIWYFDTVNISSGLYCNSSKRHSK